ncbi:hypothetical protein ONZ45_g11154 [Pleurotus djamor]|nr:hypothetical protein ONZ45_g11154 [Pleurotus djamor]
MENMNHVSPPPANRIMTEADEDQYFLSAISDAGRYAVLSHQWHSDELSFSDSNDWEAARCKKGYEKLAFLCRISPRDYQCRYVWIDTLCINKESSSELEESIQSMYTWYKNAHVCVVYLTTESAHEEDFRREGWFKRGWTLQELLASRRVKFYLGNWRKLDLTTLYDIDHVASKHLIEDHSLAQSYIDDPRSYVTKVSKSPVPIYVSGNPALLEQVAIFAGIDTEYLTGYYRPSAENACMVYRWASRRVTTRPEDIAYCLFGLLNTSISIVYGEGKARAFYRLQLACAEATSDRRIFVWKGRPSAWNSMLPDSPQAFSKQEPIAASPLVGYIDYRGDRSFSFTNCGLQIPALLYDIADAVIEKVEKTMGGIFTFGAGLSHFIMLWLGGDTNSGYPTVQLTIKTTEPPLTISEVLAWKVAVIGESEKGKFAVLLREHPEDGSYIRFATAHLYNFRTLPKVDVNTVFIR